jgi:hypothetical protein
MLPSGSRLDAAELQQKTNGAHELGTCAGNKTCFHNQSPMLISAIAAQTLPRCRMHWNNAMFGSFHLRSCRFAA